MLIHPNYEIIFFKQEGRLHTHETSEYATLLNGKCKVQINDVILNAQLNVPMAIPKNAPHKMIPEEESIFLITYN